MNQSIPFPASGGYIKAIRNSSSALRVASNIQVDKSAIERLLSSPAFTDSFERLSKAHGLAFPLQFSSAASELNFLSILSLLNFASGFRVPLHKQTGRGAWDNIRALAFSLYITSSTGEEANLLSARGMQAIDMGVIAEQLRVSIHVDRPHESIPGVTVSEVGGPMYQLVQLIVRTLNETGDVLVKMGYPDLGTFVLEALKRGSNAAKDGPPDVDVVLEQVVKAIPGFQDMYIINGTPVYCFKKALFLLFAIEARFGSSASHAIPVPSTASLPVYSDNVLPSMLIHLGILDLTSAPGALSTSYHQLDPERLLSKAEPMSDVIAKFPKEPPATGPALTIEEAYMLRAAAIDACELIIEAAHSSNTIAIADQELAQDTHNHIKQMSLRELDLWLWGVAKDRPDYRRLERFSLTDTVMF